jgi:hypothetical protein
MRSRIRNVVVGSLALACAGAFMECCSRPPVAFSRGQPIPIGPYTIVVSYTEVSASESAQALAVHFRCRGVNSREDTGKFFVAQGGHLFVLDAAGNRYSALPYTNSYYRSGGPGFIGGVREDGSPDLSEWVAVSKVPVNARGFSLLIGNPSQRSGQPRAAIVRLDR